MCGAGLDRRDAGRPEVVVVVKEYVLGFAFAPPVGREEAVLLIEKRRPDWMAGMLNGLGGHIEPGETPADAMKREGGEEVVSVDGGPAPPFAWQPVCSFGEAGRWRCHVFRALDAPIHDLVAGTDERVLVVRFSGALGGRLQLAPHVGWLIPLCLVRELRQRGELFHVALGPASPDVDVPATPTDAEWMEYGRALLVARSIVRSRAQGRLRREDLNDASFHAIIDAMEQMVWAAPWGAR